MQSCAAVSRFEAEGRPPGRKPGRQEALGEAEAGDRSAVPPAKAAGDNERSFNPDVLESTIIALPLLEELEGGGAEGELYDIIVDVNRDYPAAATRRSSASAS